MKMRGQWRRKQIISAATAAALMILFSTAALMKYTDKHGLSDINAYLNKYQIDESNTFKVYEDATTAAPKHLPTLNKKVMRAGIYQREQTLFGSLVDVRGVVSNITSNVTTELVFAFSPNAEEKFADKIVDPNHEQKVYANSPAMIWDGEKFVVVMRMWLDKEHTEQKTMNRFSDNYLYKRTYNEKMEPLDVSGKVVGIPTRVLESIGDGPIEPRVFPFYDHIYMSFNVAMYIGRKEVDTTTFWDWDMDKFVMPQITDGQPNINGKRRMPRDKHWSPYTFNRESYMIYSFDPLRIIKCDNSSVCKFTQNAAGPEYQFRDTVDCLRGGTPTVHYKDNYYISITHVTLFRPGSKRYYTVNLAVLKAVEGSKHQIVYLSEPINFDKEIMTKTPMIRTQWIEDPFFFPVTLLLEDDDNIIIGGHINDHSAYLFRVKGIKLIMDKIITQSNILEKEGPVNGVLHSLARQFAMKQSGYTFLS